MDKTKIEKLAETFNSLLKSIQSTKPSPTPPDTETYVSATVAVNDLINVNLPDGTRLNYLAEEVIYGYKGFEYNKELNQLSCRNHKFKIGKDYSVSEDEDIKLCYHGFHFCKKLDQVNEHYNLSDIDKKFYKIAAWGDIHEEVGNKLAAQSIRLIEEVTEKQLIEVLLKKKMNEIDELVVLNPNVVISGSLALILLGILPYREINDLDITLPYFSNIGNSEILDKFGKSGTECVQMITKLEKKEDIKYDLFINPTILYSMVDYDGKSYKVSDPEVIINAKFRYFMAGNKKHAGDIGIILQNYNGKTRSPITYILGKNINYKKMINSMGLEHKENWEEDINNIFPDDLPF